MLDPGTYLMIPSTQTAPQLGSYAITVYVSDEAKFEFMRYSQ